MGLCGGDSKAKASDLGEDGEGKAVVKPVPFHRLFFMASPLDVLMIVWGILCAVAHGVAMPLFIVFFGDVLDGFQPGVIGENSGCENPLEPVSYYDPQEDANVTVPCEVYLDSLRGQLLDSVMASSLSILYVALASFVFSYFQVTFFTITAQRQALRIRHAYFRALVRQEMGFYDQESSGALSARISSDIPKIQGAIGDKLGSCLQYFGMFLGGIGVGFAFSWRLTLVIFSITPLMGISGAIIAKLAGEAAAGGQGFYAKAGAIADETLRMIRTVIAFGTHELEQKRYEGELVKAKAEGRRAALVQGIGMGFTMSVEFASCALVFFYGNQLVEQEQLGPSEVVVVFFSILIGAMSIGQAAPSFAAFAAGRGAAATVLDTIARRPEIDSLSEAGERPETLEGRLSFEDVHFSYPSRPEEKVLTGLTFDVPANQTVALVGESGCGKSTCVALLERFYDPAGGRVTLDGQDLRSLNISWLRNQIALVSQQPVLFPRSIRYNIALGKDNATREEVEAAAKMANAHDFISAFPDGYDTEVGDQGAHLSGGQKQRIAIARALIKKPSILLLDEATSALDNESEREVQVALDNVSAGHTVVVVAHRLSTVFSADKVVVLRGGQVQEEGVPQELVDRGGAFYHMVSAQYGSGQPGEAFHLQRLANLEPKSSTQGDAIDGKRVKRASRVCAAGEADAALVAEEEEDVDKEALAKVKGSMLKWAWKMSRGQGIYLAAGMLGAAMEGFIWPAYAIILADVVAVLIDPDHTSAQVATWSFAFLGMAAVAFVASSLKLGMIGRASEELTFTLRRRAYGVVLHQEAAWYDAPEHSKGVITTRLAEDANAVRGILGDRVAVLVASTATLVGGLGVALYFCWSVALVVVACFPVVAAGGALQFKMVTGFASDKHFESSGKFAGDVVENVQTVASLGRLQSFVTEYTNMLVLPSRKMERTAHVQGLAFGFTEFATLAIWALAFWFGGKEVAREACNFDSMFKAVMAIVFMAMMAGQMQAFAPDAAKALKGAKRLHLLLEGKNKGAEARELERAKDRPVIRGEIEFCDVEFQYPSRPDAKVLRGLSLKVHPGETVALVGKSGCGKSTVVALLEQLYQPVSGLIKLDGRPLGGLDAAFVRQHIAYVTQQPELFSMSIGDNIRYGLTGVSQEQVEEAARQANAHNFITEFVDGYDTMVGAKGMQLSGGQRQRIAIARALVRQEKMKVLLLDEASSALDTKSEQLVHDALERFRQGRTTVMIAHRLSTIRNADRICVIDDGVVVETGTHEELMAKRRVYYDLLSSQGQLSGEPQPQPPASPASSSSAASTDTPAPALRTEPKAQHQAAKKPRSRLVSVV